MFKGTLKCFWYNCVTASTWSVALDDYGDIKLTGAGIFEKSSLYLKMSMLYLRLHTEKVRLVDHEKGHVKHVFRVLWTCIYS